MSVRLGTVWYWLSVGVAVALIAAAILWNAWTFNQHRNAQRQLDAVSVDPTIVAENQPPADSELDLLLEADRRGILEGTFIELLTEPQKHALAKARTLRLAETAADRQTSLISGVVMVLVGIVVFLAGRRARRRT